jgi:hypothetical protein
MPPPAPPRVPPPLPPSVSLAVSMAPPAVAETGPVVATARSASATAGPVPDRVPADGAASALQAQFLTGNAAAAAALLGVPPGGLAPGQFPGAAGPGLLAGQGTVGNGAVAAVGGLTPPSSVPAVPAIPGGPGFMVPGSTVAGPGFAMPVAAAGAAPAAAETPGGGPATARRPGPDKDPKFAALKTDVHSKKRAVAASHPPARSESVAAQGAARPPADDKEAQGKTANADKMDAAQPKEFDKAAFIKAVEEAIAKKAPKNLEEADEFGDSDKPKQVKQDVQQQVGAGKEASAAEIATTTTAPPDTSNYKEKQVVPLIADKPPPTPGTPDAGNAVPDKLPASATDLSGGPKQVNAQMADAQVTEAQLAHSNEPQFTNALDRKHAVEQESVQAQGKMRLHETKTLTAGKTDAQQLGAGAMHAIAGKRVATGKQVGAGKTGAKDSDEAKRAQVTATLQKVFDATKKDVEDILSGLDRKVDDQFSREEKQARDAFTTEHKSKMAEYKDRRYSGWTGKARWLRDKFLGLPTEADLIFVQARDHYVAQMRRVISNIADTIAAELGRAKARIAKGRTDLQAEIRRLPGDLQAIGKQAAADFAGKFDELAQSVDDKGTELVDTLATKYTDALKSVDDEIAAEKEKNKGLVDKVVDAVKGVIKTIIELKNLLLGVLAKAAQAVMAIIKDPVGFLRNLVSGVGAGLKQFIRNIGKHLQQGLVNWLLGTAAKAGIQLPASFDIKGILLLIASLLGLTWGAIRARIVRKVPEPAVAAAESAIPLAAKVKREGVAGMWDDLRSRVGDLKSTLISKVTEYLVPTIIVAGITWVLSLLNPASAFIRACKLIIDIVRFIVERGRQVLEFVNAVLDAVIAIAKGGGGGVPALVENALARSIPVLIGFLAAVLGIGGIADKVKKIFDTLSKPVMKAIDWVIDKIVGLVKTLWTKLKRLLDKKKDKKKPKQPRKASPKKTKPLKKAEPAKKPKPGKPAKRPKPGKKDEPGKPGKKDGQPAKHPELALDAALRDAHSLVMARLTAEEIKTRLPGIRRRHGLTALNLIIDRVEGTTKVIHFEAVINPKKESPPELTLLTRKVIEEDYGILVKNQREFQRYANEQDIVIDVRPTNPESVRWLKKDALYKPEDIKAKTIDDRDVLLGVDPAKQGLVGFFRRLSKPTRPSVPEGKYETVKKRYDQRVEEIQKYGPKMADLASRPVGPGRFVVEDDVVYGYDANGVRRPIAGDHDMFQIVNADGTELSKVDYDALIEEMKAGEFGVQHGAVRQWETLNKDARDMRELLLKQHERGGEGLVRFAPHRRPRFVYAETPI